MKNQIGNYIKHILHLIPSQIKSFGKSYIIPQDYSNLKNKKRLIVFLTKTQIKKLDKAKVNKVKVDLKFSKTQFKKTFNNVMRLNNNVSKEENRKKLQLLLKNLKEVNKKKQDKINKIKLHLLFKNKPKPKKKSKWDVIEFPKANLI